MSSYGAEFESKCKKAIEHFKKELSKVRTGRASPGLVEGLHVDYYGTSVPIQQLGMINTPEPRLITIQVYDASAAESIDKTIRQADLGLSPARDGNMIRIQVPALTEERRKEIVKRLHKMGEEGKVGIRNHRRESIDAVKKAQKDGKATEDESRKAQDEIQKITDKYVAEVDTHLSSKEKEVMEV